MRKELAGLFLLLISTPVRAERWIAASAHAPGRNGTFFVTNLRLLNTSSTETVTAQAVFFPSGGGAPVTSPELRLAPRQQLAFDDALVSLFGVAGNASGPIRVLAPESVEVSSRTLNTSDPCSGGTFGAVLPGLAPASASAHALLAGLEGSADASSGSRTNILLANPGASPASVSVTLRRGDGTLPGTATVPPIPASGSFQAEVFELTGARGETTGNAYAEIASSAPVLALATVLDNRTGDSSVVLGTRIEAPALTLVAPGDRSTYSGSYGVSGSATIVDARAIRVAGFNAAGTAPGMDLRVGLSSRPRREFRVLRVLGRQNASNATYDLTLPDGVTLNDFDTFTVWCFEFNVLIAEGRFQKP